MKSLPLIWHLLHNVKSTVKILLVFVAFLEKLNFWLKSGVCEQNSGQIFSQNFAQKYGQNSGQNFGQNSGQNSRQNYGHIAIFYLPEMTWSLWSRSSSMFWHALILGPNVL